MLKLTSFALAAFALTLAACALPAGEMIGEVPEALAACDVDAACPSGPCYAGVCIDGECAAAPYPDACGAEVPGGLVCDRYGVAVKPRDRLCD